MAEVPGQAPAQPETAAQADAAILGRLNNLFTSEAQEDAEPEAQEAQPEQQTEQEQAQEKEEQPLTIDYEAPLFDIKVKVEGGSDEERKVSLKELEAGYMMQADYQRKTAELARARETLQDEVRKAVEPQRQAFTQNLQFLQAAIQNLILPELQGADLEKLAESNPAEYVKAQAKAQRAQQALGQVQQQLQAAQQQQFQEAAEHSKRMLQDPIQGIPGWGAEVYQRIIGEGSKHYGFAPEEVANVVDYRMIKVLNDALEYRKLKSAKPEVTKKVALAPKVLKPGANQGASDSQAQKEDELRKQLRKSGDVRDATALYLSRMNRK